MYKNTKTKPFVQEKYRINDYIRVPNVFLIRGEKKVGVVSTFEAKKMASEDGLDLVEISPNVKPPVCKIMDYSKFKYELSLKEKEVKKHNKSVSMKEVRLSPNIADNDLQIKISAIKQFLEEKHSVLVKIKFFGREKAHKDLNIITKVIGAVSEYASVKSKPKFDSDAVSCLLDPISKN